MTKGTLKPRRERGKAAAQREADKLTAERIRAILSDQKTPKRIKGKLEELTYKLYAETNAFSEPTPGSCAADFRNGATGLTQHPDARAVYDEMCG
jgi:hypothetical protein